ncbi:hypothetical protein SLEP1_g57703 [Rubroshorea leprosula]|uniref:Uncharacterized protein n=1 Tax=Rubroshorea leprosula TaxID=152421 RepID=A0AAV5MQL2_9ROSI|nr:hypothetical protein SLEP1_g57703 [Rubroshorea leprosula]
MEVDGGGGGGGGGGRGKGEGAAEARGGIKIGGYESKGREDMLVSTGASVMGKKANIMPLTGMMDK